MADERYVVRGARVRCDLGQKPTRLNLPRSHGAYVNDKPMLIDTDREVEANVVPFGKCKKKGTCTPDLAPQWEDTQKNTLIKGRPALVTKSVLSCFVGGKITVETDGQHD